VLPKRALNLFVEVRISVIDVVDVLVSAEAAATAEGLAAPA
jgi:hypothetical protein